MAATNSKHKVGISYGLVSGRAHARRFVKLLNLDGYTHIHNPDHADIVVAHSAGTWLIPKTANPKLIVYIGLPLAQVKPVKTYVTANYLNLKRLTNPKRFIVGIKIVAINLYYAVRQPRRNQSIVRNPRLGRPVEFSDCPTVFIANRHDPWPRSDQLQDFIEAKDWAFISLPGSHDNIWEHPERYVAIINHYAGLLAKTDG